MSYSLVVQETIGENIRRIATEQIDQAIAELQDPRMDLADKVHEVRKRCKKLRGLVRLVRPHMKQSFALENAWYRDAARELSYARDTQVLVETHDKLVSRFREDGGGFAEIRSRLLNQRNRVVEGPRRMDRCLQSVVQRMKSGRGRVSRWDIGDDSYAAVSGGLRKTYKRTRKSMEHALGAPADENFHDWRKQVKYHWYHVRVLRPLSEDELGGRTRQLKRLSDLLGDEHDLCVLGQRFSELCGGAPGSAVGEAYRRLIDRRKQELRTEAGALGRRLFEETGKAFTHRIGEFWTLWESRKHEASSQAERMSA